MNKIEFVSSELNEILRIVLFLNVLFYIQIITNIIGFQHLTGNTIQTEIVNLVYPTFYGFFTYDSFTGFGFLIGNCLFIVVEFYLAFLVVYYGEN